MDTLIPVLCLLSGVVLTLGTIGLALKRGVRQLAVASAYREVARDLGLQIDTRGVSVRGHLGDRRIWIGEVLEAEGLDRRVEVRGVLTLKRPLALGLQVRRRGRTDRLWSRGRAPEVRLGEPDLDRILHVHGDDPERVRALFVPAVRESLRLLAARWPDLVLTDDELQVWLRQPADDPTELAELVDAMVRSVEAMEEARREVPAAHGLEADVTAWGPVADALSLDLEPWLPAMTGLVEGHRVLVAAQREADGYAATLRLWFNPHPELGLLLRPQVEPDGYWSVGQDIQVGDAEFDAAFVVKGYDPSAVCARLSEGARKRLLELTRLGTLVVDDQGLLLRGMPLDPKQVTDAIRRAAAAARAIGW